ncbi:aspartyl/asparaginyl beta-hydroxylase, partial [Reticulomyxa filosa]
DELYLAVWPKTSSWVFWNPENVPDGEPLKLGWKVGEDFLFDDTCVHEVKNGTVCRRIILFMDMERHDIPWWSRAIHRVFMHIAKLLPAVQRAIDVQDKVLKTKIENQLKKKSAKGNGKQKEIANDQQEEEEEEEEENDATHNSNINTWTCLTQAYKGLGITYPELMPYNKARQVVGTVKLDKNGSIIRHVDQ